jgi:hypothetical protein
MGDHVAALRACFASLGKQLVGFERNLAGRQPGGNHAFLNCVGVDDAAAGATKAAFIAAAKRAGFEFECEIPAEGTVGERQAALSEAVGKGEFCAVTLPDGAPSLRLVSRTQPCASSSFWGEQSSLCRRVFEPLADCSEQLLTSLCLSVSQEGSSCMRSQRVNATR